MSRLFAVLAILMLTVSACDTESQADSALCGDRTSGALITFQIVAETYTGWFTNAEFITAAEGHLAAGTAQVPLFEQVIAGSDCDAQWGFHVSTQDVDNR